MSRLLIALFILVVLTVLFLRPSLNGPVSKTEGGSTIAISESGVEAQPDDMAVLWYLPDRVKGYTFSFTTNGGLPVSVRADRLSGVAKVSAGPSTASCSLDSSDPLPEVYLNSKPVIIGYYPKSATLSMSVGHVSYLIQRMVPGDSSYQQVSQLKKLNIGGKEIYYNIIPSLSEQDTAKSLIEFNYFIMDKGKPLYQIYALAPYTGLLPPENYREIVSSFKYEDRF